MLLSGQCSSCGVPDTTQEEANVFAGELILFADYESPSTRKLLSPSSSLSF